MTELLPLAEYTGGINTDLDGTLAPSDAAFPLLVERIVEGEGLSADNGYVDRYVYERGLIRTTAQAEAKAAGSKNGKPYDVYHHLGVMFELPPEQIDEYVDVVAESGPDLMLPGARKWLQIVGGLAIPRRIVSYGHQPTQDAKMRMNDVSRLVEEFGFEVAIVDGRKGPYFSSQPDNGPEMHVDDRENNMVGMPERLTPVLIGPAEVSRAGLVVVRDLPHLLALSGAI
ncbi:MAG TPA: hypothetical protein VLH38_05840 [Patescibacteria group bacterium]|nr:hypothetical protein [Patescibacteria group bacterium]